jgi:hypothetical protein
MNRLSLNRGGTYFPTSIEAALTEKADDGFENSYVKPTLLQ